MKKGALLCLSGGVESTTLAYLLKYKFNYENVIALNIDYGHRANKEEIFCIKYICRELDFELIRIRLPFLKKISRSYLTSNIKIPEVKIDELNNEQKAKERMKWWWVPSRNAIISVVALSIAESKLLYENELYHVYLGLRCETPVPMPDNTKEFLNSVNYLYENSILDRKKKIKAYAPLITLTKDKIIKLGNKLKVDWRYTYSCYSGNSGKFINNLPVHCGICSNCKRRKMAFEEAKILDTSIYLR